MQKVLANLTVRQRISIVAALIVVLTGVYAILRQQKEAGFKPLFTGLAPEDAAQIVQKLKEAGIEYRLPEGGGSVLAPAARLPELRLTMAASGLPKTGRMGFELFDKANLGATEFTEHINYRRALEGELERSITSLSEVEQARVHLTFPKDSVFVESQQPAKASVMVKVKAGARIAPQNVLAINHMVASAVEGLSPDAVTVIDMNGNLLGRPKPASSLDGPEASDAILDYRRKIENDLSAKITSTLEPLLGANRFHAGVSVECDYSGGELSEETFDPARSVMLSSQRTEDTSTAGTTAAGAASGGIAGTASNLPRPTSRPASGSKGVSRVTENITYQTTRTVKKTRLPAGGVRKMSLAVLVDQQLTWEREGPGYRRVLTPPAPEKLRAIHDLVAGVTGFSAERGDQLVVESLPFESTQLLEPPAPQAAPAAPSEGPVKFGFTLDKKTMLAAAGAAAGILVLAFLTALLFGKKKKVKVVTPAPVAAMPQEVAAAPHAVPELPGAPIENRIESRLAEHEAKQKRLEEEALQSLQLTPAITKTAEVLTKHIRDKVAKAPDISAQILRTWIREEDVKI
jgi:flagellar M-ring protein FliF